MRRDEISRLTERNEVEVWHDMMAALPPETVTSLGAGCRDIGGALLVAARNLPAVTFNRAIGIGLDGRPARENLLAIADAIRANCAPVAQLQVAPLPENAGIEPLLADAGFRPADVRWVKMGRRTDDVPMVETALAIETVTPATASEFAAVVRQGFGLPPAFDAWLAALAVRPRWVGFIARKEGIAVSAGAMYCGADCAWLGMAATLPDFRRLGGQGALLAHRVAEAASRGLPWVFTETGVLPGRNPSLENMRRAGFQTLHERENWVLAS